MKWQALDNLSVPRANDPEHKTDLVVPGDTVDLTEEQASHYLGTCRCPPHQQRRQYPSIRKAAEASKPMPQMPPRLRSGPLRGPASAIGERADPKGSSRIIEQKVPEMDEPSPGSESGDENALDLPPGTRVAAGAR